MINPVVYNVSLDIYKIGSQKVLSMVRGDTKRSIVIHLTENERPYALNEGCTAKFTALKPDGNFIYNDCEVDFKSNTITYQVTPQTTAVNGRVDCQLRLIGANGGIITSPSFSVVVADLLYNEEPIVDSSDEFNALTNYVAELEKKLARGDFNGKSIYIRGSVNDPSELDEYITTSEAGDGYIAGDNHLYVFDGDTFLDVGLVRGPQGLSGVYVGSGDMPEGYNVQIDLDGEVFTLDKELDAGSENPIANKPVAEAIEALRKDKADAKHEHSADEVTCVYDGGDTTLPAVLDALKADKAEKGETLKAYYSLAPLGLNRGTETIELIAMALPLNSILIIPVSPESAAIYPQTTPYATLIVIKLDDTRVVFDYIDKVTGNRWTGSYSSSNLADKWTGWKRFLTEADTIKSAAAVPFTYRDTDISNVEQALTLLLSKNGI